MASGAGFTYIFALMSIRQAPKLSKWPFVFGDVLLVGHDPSFSLLLHDLTGAQSRMRKGGLASINVTMLTYPKNLEGSVTIIGEKGTVRLGGVAVNKIEHWAFADPDPDDELVEKASYDTTSVYGHGHTGYYDNVLKSLRGEATPETDGREGLRSLELLIGTYLSARDGRAVSLPLDY